MNKEPLVSVVMSVYNGERFLRPAIESILSQSFSDFDFIIIDDGSTDGSGAILDSYKRKDSRLRVYHQENRGLVESLNRGCGLAHGKYVARMDADDIAMGNRLMQQVDFLERHPEIGLVGGAVEIVNAAGGLIRILRYPTSDGEIQSALLRGSSPFCHPAVLMRKDVLASVAGYRKLLVHAEDYDLYLRIAERFQVANLAAVVLKYRLHPHQIGSRMFREMALTSLAARAAAWSRREGRPDPLDSVAEVTPTFLTGLGVSQAAQHTWLARRYLTYFQNMSNAGERIVPPDVVLETLKSPDLRRAERAVVADFYLWAALLYWREKRFARSVFAGCRALVTWPVMLGRPLKGFLNQLCSSNDKPPRGSSVMRSGLHSRFIRPLCRRMTLRVNDDP